ncbi:MAG: hypothetical protein Q9174_007208, partial [Haloplaca sp. 1 TL-2023]
MASTQTSYRTLGAFLLLLFSLLLYSTYPIVRHNVIVEQILGRQIASQSTPLLTPTSSTTKTIPLPFGTSSFTANFTTHTSHPKRALPDQFRGLVCKGTRYADGVTAAIAGNGPAAPVFPTPGGDTGYALNNGWQYDDDFPDNELPSRWTPVFEMMPQGYPPEGEPLYVELNQQADFVNVNGEEQDRIRGNYHAFYIVSNTAILITYSQSPVQFVTTELDIPASEVDAVVPPLHRLSDAIWLIYGDLDEDGAGALRFIMRDNINNDVTSPLLEHIFRTRRGTLDVPWENRLTFDLDSDEGKALFGSPNGVAVAWVLIHRVQELGRRMPRVSIFRAEGKNCMVWDLVPQGVEPLYE